MSSVCKGFNACVRMCCVRATHVACVFWYNEKIAQILHAQSKCASIKRMRKHATICKSKLRVLAIRAQVRRASVCVTHA